MEKRRFALALVAAVTFCGLVAVARADAPSGERATPVRTQARKKKRTVKAPKVSFECKTDDDCALTKMGDNECCPMLCQPRAVSKASAEAVEKYAATCAKPSGGRCAVPECAPPRFTVAPACVSGKCEARAQAGSRD